MKTQTTRRLLLGVALGGVLAAGFIANATPAHADVQDFLYDVHASGWTASRGDAGLVANGYRVCQMLNSTTGDVVARYVYENTDQSVTRADALEFVIISVQDLCPWHDHRGQGSAAA